LVPSGSGTYFTLPPSFSLQLQNGSLCQSGAQYLNLKSLTNANYRSFPVQTAAVADIFGIVPSLCVYNAQICAVKDSVSSYQLTLFITPSVTAEDPLTLLDLLAVREYTFVGNANVINVDFPYVAYNRKTSCFEVVSAAITINMNYTPNTLVQAITNNGTSAITTVEFDFVFNGNQTTVSDLPTFPYIATTQLTTTQVNTLNKNALYNIGTNYMGSLLLPFQPKQVAPFTCNKVTDTFGAQVGAYQNV